MTFSDLKDFRNLTDDFGKKQVQQNAVLPDIYWELPLWTKNVYLDSELILFFGVRVKCLRV